MSFGFVMNFEKLAMEIVEDELAKMTNENLIPPEKSEPEGELDEELFANNLRHGVIASTYIVNLYETALNTIISKRIECKEEDVLKASHGLKLHLICIVYGLDHNEITGKHFYASVKEVTKLRDDITHYKTNDICEGSFVQADIKMPMGKSKKPLVQLFTQKNMQQYYDGVMGFLQFLCDKCKLQINYGCQIIDCDARDIDFEFISEQYSEEEDV